MAAAQMLSFAVLHGCSNGFQVTLRKPADRSFGREIVLLPAPHLSKLLEDGWEFDLGMFRAVGLEAFKDLFAIHLSDCIVSTRLKTLVEIRGPSFSPNSGFLAGFDGHAPSHRKDHRIWQALMLVSSHKCQ
jgi:hypothetical protein